MALVYFFPFELERLASGLCSSCVTLRSSTDSCFDFLRADGDLDFEKFLRPLKY